MIHNQFRPYHGQSREGQAATLESVYAVYPYSLNPVGKAEHKCLGTPGRNEAQSPVVLPLPGAAAVPQRPQAL